jgi:hypothetical protein
MTREASSTGGRNAAVSPDNTIVGIVALGAQRADSLRALADLCDVLILVVVDDEQVMQVGCTRNALSTHPDNQLDERHGAREAPRQRHSPHYHRSFVSMTISATCVTPRHRTI